MSKDFLTALKNRRSYYAISKDSVISDERIQEIVKDAVKYRLLPSTPKAHARSFCLVSSMTSCGILRKAF